MSRGRRLLVGAAGMILGLGTLAASSMTVMASNSKTYLETLNVGVATIIDKDAYATTKIENNDTALASNVISTSVVIKEAESDLVMANVNNAVNVRKEPNEDSGKVGLLYKDCGGTILERGDGWTKIQSGEVIGWVCNDYLLFNEEAEALAKDVGTTVATVETDALRIRKEASTEAGVYGLAANGDELEVLELIDDEWISIDYEGEIGYVSAQYVSVDFVVDSGETMEAIKEREKAEAEAKAKLTANYGAVIADADDTRLLAALIQCEAGGECYEGQLAVGAVVMNRVRSSAYPNTISGVIYASGQFTPALNGKVAKVYNGTVKESCLQAAEEALAGNSNVGTSTHFRRVGYHDGVVIGNHVFW